MEFRLSREGGISEILGPLLHDKHAALEDTL